MDCSSCVQLEPYSIDHNFNPSKMSKKLNNICNNYVYLHMHNHIIVKTPFAEAYLTIGEGFLHEKDSRFDGGGNYNESSQS